MLRKASPGTAVAGIVVSVVIVLIIGSMAYFQFEVAPGIYTTTTTSTTATGLPPKGTYVNVTIPSGASSPNGAPGYSPDTITLVLGKNATIFWKNLDTAIHTATADGGGFNTADIVAGGNATTVFTTTGTYTFRCIYHSWMVGHVTVKA